MNTNYWNIKHYKYLIETCKSKGGFKPKTNALHLKKRLHTESKEIKRLSYLNSVYKLTEYADARVHTLRGRWRETATLNNWHVNDPIKELRYDSRTRYWTMRDGSNTKSRDLREPSGAADQGVMSAREHSLNLKERTSVLLRLVYYSASLTLCGAMLLSSKIFCVLLYLSN